MRFASLLSLLTLVACGGSDPTSLISDQPGGGSPDGGVVSPTGDSGMNPAMCDPARCNLTVPAGFTLVTPGERATDCGNGFTKIDVLVDPVADPKACTCACNVTQQPDCTGAIHRTTDFQNMASCNQPATQLMTGNGCQQLQNAIQTYGSHYAAKIDAQGGACTYDAKVDPSLIKAKDARLCQAPSSCAGAVCGKNACVMKDGDVDCPSGFPQKRVVGDVPTAECGSCGACTVEGTCDGTLSFFTDQSCTQGKHDFPIDGTCNANNVNQVYHSFEAQSMIAKAGCAGAPTTTTGKATFAKPSTVCCQK